MVYTYTPAYYSSLHDTITSLCKSILPFSFKNRRLTSQQEQKLAKRQSDNLKWQQESFHRILNLIGLQKEGIASEREVAAFRSHLLDTLVSSPADQEPPGLIRDKLLFLQELLYAKCISSEEYHSSKRPLLQRLAVQGVEIDSRDVIVGGHAGTEEEQWSVIELTEESPAAKENKPKQLSSIKPIKGAMSLIGIASGKGKSKKKPAPGSTPEPFVPVDLNRPSNAAGFDPLREKPFWEEGGGSVENLSVLMPESSQNVPVKEEKVKKKSFRTLFQKEQMEGSGKKERTPAEEKRTPKSSRTPWGFDGLRKWKRSNWEDEATTPYLPPGERSDDASSLPCALVPSPVGEGPDTKRIKKKMHPDGGASDFFIDKVLGENIKKELSRIQSELNTTNPNLSFSDDQIEAISTRLPVDKADLKKFFPKTWCDRYGEIVLDVVRKEFRDHVGEMEALRNTAKERRESSEKKWVAFDEDDGDFRTNLFFRDQTTLNEAPSKGADGCFANNHLFHDDQNAFWASGNSR